jgi:hypothetical protein
MRMFERNLSLTKNPIRMPLPNAKIERTNGSNESFKKIDFTWI